jgi:AcrR family transcriptional regulator
MAVFTGRFALGMASPEARSVLAIAPTPAAAAKLSMSRIAHRCTARAAAAESRRPPLKSKLSCGNLNCTNHFWLKPRWANGRRLCWPPSTPPLISFVRSLTARSCLTLLSLSDRVELSLSDTHPRGGLIIDARKTSGRASDAANQKQAEARLAVSRHACDLFWERGVAATSGDDIAAAAGLSTRTIWRYFRTKESCVEPVLAKSAHRFLAIVDRWPLNLSLAEHLAADTARNPLAQQDIVDEISAMRIATMTTSEPALRTAYLMVHDEMEQGFIPVVAKRLHLADDDLTVRLCAVAVTGAFRVIDEDVSRTVVGDKKKVTQREALSLIDRAIREATNSRLGGPVTP